MTTVSCIIPTYNEGPRIGRVLAAVVHHPLVDEVIVVDDGSTDDTCSEVAKASNVRLLRTDRTRGKSHAMAAGIRVSMGSLLLFLDGDLLGLMSKDVTALIQPVIEDAADFSISLRGNALPPWRLIGLDYLSGERVLHRAMIANHLDVIENLPGFGFESYINALLLRTRARMTVVWWPDVESPYKARKYGVCKGIAGEMRMLTNIVETVSLVGTGYQIAAMLRARVCWPFTQKRSPGGTQEPALPADRPTGGI